VRSLVLTTGRHFVLAAPAVVALGSAELLQRFPRSGEISRAQLETYAADIRASGDVPEVEIRYGELMAALRIARAKALVVSRPTLPHAGPSEYASAP
jgi:hypothetical protein